MKLVSGQVLTEKRNRLDPDLLADLVFCGENLDFVRDGHRVENVAAAAAACSSSSSTAAAVAQQPGSSSSSSRKSKGSVKLPSVMELLKKRKEDLAGVAAIAAPAEAPGGHRLPR